MGDTSLLDELADKEDNAQQIAKTVVEESSLVSYILTALSSREAGIRFKAAKTLRIISEKSPELLYPYFDFFKNLLDSSNNIIKWNAMDVMANLATVDSGNKFNEIFGKFYCLLNEGSLITATHVIDNSGRIAEAKPYLENRITKELLKVGEIPLPTEECRNIIKGKVILAFSQYYDRAGNKDVMLSFVKGQLNNSRNATRKKAEKFLKMSGGA